MIQHNCKDFLKQFFVQIINTYYAPCIVLCREDTDKVSYFMGLRFKRKPTDNNQVTKKKYQRIRSAMVNSH